jgi:hypothetical protein
MAHISTLERVRAEYGLAMYEAQLFEQYLAHAVLAATDAKGAGFENMERLVRRQPMGALVRRLTAVVAMPSHLRNRLEAARENRNCLAHHYFERRSSLLQTRAGRAAMIRELDEISDEFYRLWGVLDAAVVAWFARTEPKPSDFGEDLLRATAEA